jgi:hypothetical protein
MSLSPRPEGSAILILRPLRRARDMQGCGRTIDYFHNAKITYDKYHIIKIINNIID